MKKSFIFSLWFFLGLFMGKTAFTAERFEALAWVDNYDFGNVSRSSGEILFDSETEEGTMAIMNHVLETGATTILWRNCGGSTMRYQSAEENYPWIEAPLDKRRIPSSRPVYGWLRYEKAEPDILRTAMEICHQKGVGAGVHWPYEETHWVSWTFGAWNLEHPQYWSISSKGNIWSGRCSISFPEVQAHKLRLVDELLERGVDHLFIETRRTGGWTPEWEYVKPMIDLWKERYGTEPPKDSKNQQWCMLVAEQFQSYLQAVKKRINASGRDVRLLLGMPTWKDEGGKGVDPHLLNRGVDWKHLVEERIVDGIVLQNVNWDPNDPYGSTRKAYSKTVSFCKGKCQVFFPVSMYSSYLGGNIPGYQKVTKESAVQVVEKLIRIAWEEGADGIAMECVDYNNYRPVVRQKMRYLLANPFRYKRDQSFSFQK